MRETQEHLNEMIQKLIPLTKAGMVKWEFLADYRLLTQIDGCRLICQTLDNIEYIFILSTDDRTIEQVGGKVAQVLFHVARSSVLGTPDRIKKVMDTLDKWGSLDMTAADPHPPPIRQGA